MPALVLTRKNECYVVPAFFGKGASHLRHPGSDAHRGRLAKARELSLPRQSIGLMARSEARPLSPCDSTRRTGCNPSIGDRSGKFSSLP